MSGVIHIIFVFLLITVPVKIISMICDALINAVAEKVIEKINKSNTDKP